MQNRIENSRPNKIQKIQKKWIAGIDVGMRHIGLSVYKPEEDSSDSIPFVEKSSIYINRQGKGWKEYQESSLVEMVYNWVRDRYVDIFQHCQVVIIEKQMLPVKKPGDKMAPIVTIKQRGCLLAQIALETIFRCYIPLGGPIYVVKGPTWAKNRMGVTYGQKSGKKGGTHSRNKTNSKKRFKELYGDQAFKDLVGTWGRKVDDVIDAMWIALSGAKEIETILNEYRCSHHTLDVQSLKTKISKKDRMDPIERLDVKTQKTFDVHELEQYLKTEMRNKVLSKLSKR